MGSAGQVIDFQKYIADRDIDTRIKQNRDDMLGIIRAEIKAHDSNVEVEFANVDAEFAKVYAEFAKVDAEFASVRSEIKALDAKVDNLAASIGAGFKALEASIKQGKTLNKWIFGMFVTIILGLAGLGLTIFLSLAN